MTKKSKILKWFDGKKTTIAAFYWGFITPALPIYYGSFEAIPEDVMKVCGIIGLFLTYLGLGHKGVKTMKKVK